MSFAPRFTITNPMTAGLTRIERARGFLDAAHLSDEWIRSMGRRALLLESHHMTHIEGTQLTLAQGGVALFKLTRGSSCAQVRARLDPLDHRASIFAFNRSRPVKVIASLAVKESGSLSSLPRMDL